MTNSKTTKRALFSSVVALLLCFTMLLGTTFAWFTDSASTAVNTIQSGTLKVDLVDTNDVSLEGRSLTLKGTDNAYFEPGATFATEEFKVKNNGNLALKFKLALNGIEATGETSTKLLEVLTFNVVGADGTAVDLTTFEGHLTAGQSSGIYTIQATMDKDAGNEYQNLSATGIGITVYATQDTVESDMTDNQYDKDATYDGSVNPGNPPAGDEDAINVTSVAELLDAISNASTDAANPTVISIDSSFEVSEAIAIPAGTYVEINGNGNTISRTGDSNVSTGSVALAKDTMFYIEGNASITNLTIDAKGNDANRLRGVVVKGNVDLTGCTIKGAYTPDNAGGAVTAVGGTVNLDNCTITGNTAKTGAAALGDAAGTVNITNTTISGNTGTAAGGQALYGYADSVINISNSTIEGDSALYLVGATPSVTYTISGDVAIDDIYDANSNASHRVIVNGVAEFHSLPAIRLTSALEKDLVFYVNNPDAGQLIIRRTLLEGANGYTLTDADLAHVKVYYKDGVTADYTEYDASNATYELVVQDNRIEFVQK